MKLFLDANIVFTAAYSLGGLSRGLLRLSAAGKCTLFTSAFAHEEAVRNISKKAPEKTADLEMLMQWVSILPEPRPQVVSAMERLPLAQKDAPVLAAAVQAKMDVFVTGDRRDFGHLYGQNVGTLKILTPGDTLKEVAQSM